MQKLYRVMEWLEPSQAAHYLELLTDTAIEVEHILQACIAMRLTAYVDCGLVKGEEEGSDLTVLSGGIQRLRHPEGLTREKLEPIEDGGNHEEVIFAYRPKVAGPAWIFPADDSGTTLLESVNWMVTTGPKHYQVMFKPADIEGLAAEMNKEDQRKPLDTAPKPSHLLIIAAMLELLLEPVERPRGKRNQAAIIDMITEKYDFRGLGKRTIENIYSEANQAINEAKKEKS